MMPEDTYTTQDLMLTIRRRRRAFFYPAILLLAASIALAIALPDQYESGSKMDINLEGAGVSSLEPIVLTAYADRYLRRLQDQVLMPDNLLAMANDDVIVNALDGMASEDQRVKYIRENLSISVVSQPVLSPSSGREVDLISGINISSKTTDPAISFNIATMIANQFLEQDRETRTQRASSASLFLREQMDEVEVEIVGLENRIAEFKVDNSCCLPEIKDFNLSVIQRAERDLEDLLPRLRALEKERVFLATELDQLRSGNAADTRIIELEEEYLTLVANYGPEYPRVVQVQREIEALRDIDEDAGEPESLQILRQDLVGALKKYSDEHPDVIRLRQDIAREEALFEKTATTNRSKFGNSPRNIQLRSRINEIDSELQELRTRVPETRSKIEEYERRLSVTPQVESEFQALDRKLVTANENFQSLQEHLVIARQTEAFESTDIGARLTEIRPPVFMDSPTGPRRLAIVLVGVVMSLIVGVGLMVILELMDGTIRGGRDVQVVAHLIPLAEIPVIQNSTAVVMSRRRRMRFVVSIAVTMALVFSAIVFRAI